MNDFLEVAIDTPLRRVFDYRRPASIAADSVRPGTRVWVPFGRRRLIGIVLRVKDSSELPVGKIKAAFASVDAEPTFDSVLFDLLVWSAEYYRHPIGEVLAAAMPTALRKGAPLHEQTERWQLTVQGGEAAQTLPKRSTRLRALVDALANNADATQLAAISPTWRAGLRELEARGWATRSIADRPVLKQATVARASEHELNAAQNSALASIMSARHSFRPLLLHGVTGSGKTEVYLRAIESVIADGEQALVLVPEIALTPQLVARFQARFETPLAVLHSSLNDAERLAAWRAARSGSAPIVIGTRSAIFTPLARPGLIVVDEEHDTSYKQQEGFRYSARDLAIMRAQRQGIPVVLGSATPSLESLARTRTRPDDLLELPLRAGSAQPPQLRLVDLRRHAHTDGLATPTILAMQRHLDADGQVLLYLNRRGYAPVWFCPACGWSATCSRCDARMTVHQRERKLACHHCGHESAIPELCGSCHASAKPVGQGTERIEESIGKLFPNAPIARIDRDSVRRKGELEAVIEQINSGAVRILIGTQMLTKGHHFPNVTLVAVLNADQGLFGTDFRASERLAQNIIQVAGRAGRAERAGEVFIQTEYPEHPLLTGLLSGGYLAFAQQALLEREQAHWPPFARLALVRAEDASMAGAMNLLNAARDLARDLTRNRNGSRGAVRILGPVTAPMARRAGRYRAQLLLHAPAHGPLQSLLSRWVPQLEALPQAKKARWSIDVDPIELF